MENIFSANLESYDSMLFIFFENY